MDAIKHTIDLSFLQHADVPMSIEKLASVTLSTYPDGTFSTEVSFGDTYLVVGSDRDGKVTSAYV